MPLVKYFKESLEEFNHVTWPTKKQTIRLTILVIVFVSISAGLIGGFDTVLKSLLLMQGS